MITVMGATGRTGGQIATRLLAAGEKVRAIGRSPSRLAELADAGAEPVAGDANDPAFLAAAFRDADAVYTLLPVDPTWPDYDTAADSLGDAVAAAVRESGVRHVVALSSLGAELPGGTGFIASLYRQEQRLRGIPGANVLALRCGMFFESLLPALDVIRAEGVNADSMSPDTRVPMIASADAAERAARVLRQPDWTGFVVRELLGERALSYAEVTAIIGERIGRPDLTYLQLPDADMRHALVGAGLSADIARQTVEMTRAISDRTIRSLEGRRPANTTPTSFADFLARQELVLDA